MLVKASLVVIEPLIALMGHIYYDGQEIAHYVS